MNKKKDAPEEVLRQEFQEVVQGLVDTVRESTSASLSECSGDIVRSSKTMLESINDLKTASSDMQTASGELQEKVRLITDLIEQIDQLKEEHKNNSSSIRALTTEVQVTSNRVNENTASFRAEKKDLLQRVEAKFGSFATRVEIMAGCSMVLAFIAMIVCFVVLSRLSSLLR